MSIVYQHQLHSHKIRRWHWRRWLIGLIVLVVGVFAGLQQLKPDTKISKAKVVTRQIVTDSKKQSFHKGLFSMTLPADWQFMGVQRDIYTIYHFRSTASGEKGSRLMDVYEDSNLPNFPINRMLPVEATDEGGLITDASQVSDNCTAYTTGDTAGRTQTGQLAKWQGIQFMCDMANPLRNVVGTGSKDGQNTVNVKSLTNGTHHYFLTYTENNDKPDYTVFTAAINSFKVDQ